MNDCGQPAGDQRRSSAVVAGVEALGCLVVLLGLALAIYVWTIGALWAGLARPAA